MTRRLQHVPRTLRRFLCRSGHTESEEGLARGFRSRGSAGTPPRRSPAARVAPDRSPGPRRGTSRGSRARPCAKRSSPALCGRSAPAASSTPRHTSSPPTPSEPVSPPSQRREATRWVRHCLRVGVPVSPAALAAGRAAGARHRPPWPTVSSPTGPSGGVGREVRERRVLGEKAGDAGHPRLHDDRAASTKSTLRPRLRAAVYDRRVGPRGRRT